MIEAAASVLSFLFLVWVTVMALIFLFAAYVYIKVFIKKSRCSHQRYTETSACDAICVTCGKNLGFIGNIRDV